MQRLITPERVIELSFPRGEWLPSERIPSSLILHAEERYLRPIVGRTLYTALLEGDYSAFTEEYIHPLLACAVRYLLLPELRVSVGAAGVAEPSAEGWESASEEAYTALRRALREQLRTLRYRLSEALEEQHHQGLMPEYLPDENILNRCGIHGGVVQTY